MVVRETSKVILKIRQMMVYSLILDNIINYIISIGFIMLRQLSIVGVLVMSISRISIYIYIQQIGSRYS